MRLLDLFCGGGGCSVGYHRAGFEDIVGVDHVDQPDYPFTFVRADALTYLAVHGHEFDAIHASPPCWSQTTLTKGTQGNAGTHVDLIGETRALLRATHLPTVMENVQSSTLRRSKVRDLTLCGEMFGLNVIRHRWFEIEGFLCPQPEHKPHRGRVSGWRHGELHEGPYRAVYGHGGFKGTTAEWKEAMDIDWMSTRRSMAQAIPPPYTAYIGRHLMTWLRSEVSTESVLG